ncbi:MAG: hypothetical protein LBG52_04285 [Candidatus Peribacteria bacterium]|nr:hypothetical protein [Candidatus Peribacteria bacterium]
MAKCEEAHPVYYGKISKPQVQSIFLEDKERIEKKADGKIFVIPKQIKTIFNKSSF